MGRWGWAAAAAVCASCGGAVPFEAAKYFTPASRSAEIDTIVIHTTEGPYDESKSFEENHEAVYRWTIRYFKNPDPRKVSAHYVVGPRGQVTQMVRDQDVAWHATYYNRRSIGIECAGWSARKDTWTPELLGALARLGARLARSYPIPMEHPAGDAVSWGGYFEGRGFVGHTQIQTPGSRAVEKHASKTDPGPHFPWEELMRRVAGR
jgi:N-acetyl-anhydromuramyl-L-alanine amidase AmpD